MSLDARLPLMVRQPDIVGQMGRGAQTAQLLNTVGRESRLAALLRDQGPQIMSGDRNALAQLAQFSPERALGIQDARQSMQLDAERLKQIRASAAQAAKAESERLSAQEKAAQMAEAERVVSMALADPDNADQYLASSEHTKDYIGTPIEAVAAAFLGIKDAWEASKPSDPKDRFKVAGNTVFDLEAEGGPQAVGTGQGTKKTIRDAEGNVLYEEGPASETPPKLTVDAGKNTGFYIRTLDAHDTITELEEQGLDFLQQNAEAIPLGLGNYMRTPEFQQFDQARRDFVNAILRRESGAVIADSEFDNANKQYFPQPGDKPKVIAQKRRNRRNAIRGLRVGSGEGAGFVERENAASESPQQSTDGTQDIPPPPTGYTDEDWRTVWELMPEEDRELFR